VKQAYLMAWELGCKGLTVYRRGSREEEVLSVTDNNELDVANVGNIDNVDVIKTLVDCDKHDNDECDKYDKVESRPKFLRGVTVKKQTPVGSAFVTLNVDEDNEPFEAFLNVGKAGSEVAAVSEALGRLISLILRLPSGMSRWRRLEEIIDQLGGIGGSRPSGFGHNRVKSLPDGVAQALSEILKKGTIEELLEVLRDNGQEASEAESGFVTDPFVLDDLTVTVLQDSTTILQDNVTVSGFVTASADLCPECGEASFVEMEGCKRCVVCGFSEC